jgi:FkbM family methyltransferase
MSRFTRTARRHFKAFGLGGFYRLLRARVLPGAQEFQVCVPGAGKPVALRADTSDIGTYVQIFVEREYDFETLEQPSVIIDAGANIGLASVYFANKFPNAKIIAVEPEASNYSLLERNVSPYERIVPLHCALWGENSRIKLVDPGFGKWGFQTHASEQAKAADVRDEVEAVTVDRIMRDHGIEFIDVLKMDIEGAEKEVFENAAPWIDKVGILIVELHERLKQGCSRSFYNATNDFDLEWQRGENIFLARSGKCPARPSA